MVRQKRTWGVLSLLALALCVPPLALASDDKKKPVPSGTPIIWREPADIVTRDLYHGPGGKEMMPDLSKVTFIKEEQGGHSTKYRVRDGAGREWVAKMGVESKPETAATRLLWALGYFAEVTYLVPKVTIEGKGTFENVRFEARPDAAKRMGEWRWDSNPFVGTKEFQGLKIMMILLGNWDIKDSNNLLLQVRNDQTGRDELQYVISDLGSTIGKTGGFFTRTRNEPQDYVRTKFISGVEGRNVDFNYDGKRKEIFQNITIEQARWLGQWLNRLSDQQIRDAFRAANYTPDEEAALTEAMRARIDALLALPETRGPAAVKQE